MIIESHGDLLDAQAGALVNTVNTVGVMGKGIALQFKRAFPDNFKAYKRASDDGELELGRMFVWDAGALVGHRPRYIINFPTKKHWRSKSELSDIQSGLADLVRQIRRLDIKSVAIPPLGCGNGGLRWDDVRPLIEEAFTALPDVAVLLYPPEGAPAVQRQPVRTDMPKMTPGRAALIGMVQRYLPYAIEVTAVDIQKLMYFMQEAGEPLRLDYVKGRYGPYADNLRHVLGSMEGHYIRGIGDGSGKALDTLPFEILDSAESPAEQLLANQPETSLRMRRVTKLIEGYESAYGLELLATVHWPAVRDADDVRRAEPATLDETERAVKAWNQRKAGLFTTQHIAKAYGRLASEGWFDASGQRGMFAESAPGR